MVEMNTILNQANELMEAADDYVSAPPDPPRDELDILGMAMDFRASATTRTRSTSASDTSEEWSIYRFMF